MTDKVESITAAETVAEISAEVKDNLSGEVQKVTEKQERFDLKFFKRHPLYVSIKLSKTTPLRNYESAKVEISVLAPVGVEIPKESWNEMDKVYASISEWAGAKMEEQILAIEHFKKEIVEQQGGR